MGPHIKFHMTKISPRTMSVASVTNIRYVLNEFEYVLNTFCVPWISWLKYIRCGQNVLFGLLVPLLSRRECSLMIITATSSSSSSSSSSSASPSSSLTCSSSSPHLSNQSNILYVPAVKQVFTIRSKRQRSVGEFYQNNLSKLDY